MAYINYNPTIKAASGSDSKLKHIKMHGALYHATAQNLDYATWLIELLKEFYLMVAKL
jgi:lactam utilization protein B